MMKAQEIQGITLIRKEIQRLKTPETIQWRKMMIKKWINLLVSSELLNIKKDKGDDFLKYLHYYACLCLLIFW